MEMTTQEEIVVVEDDASMMQAIQRLLQAAGFRALTFSSAEALLQSDVAASAACLVFDIHLPGLSGLELRQRLLASGVQSPVIFVTAHDELDMHETARRSGAVACLLKPFPGRRLLDAIGQAIGRPVGCIHSRS